MKTATLKTLEQTDNVSLYSICFDGKAITEYEADSRKLRLYCLRISDQILIVGNGGIKTTRTYQENDELSGYVMDLQEFDKLLAEAQKDGSITIEKNVITGIESKVFQL